MNVKLKKYLKENYVSIGIKDAKKNYVKDLNIMDEDVKNYTIFLTGENHGVKSNVELKMEFLKYFKERTDFKYLICELPASMVYFLKKYLNTGDEETLKNAYRALEGTDAWNLDEYMYWIDLYNYNKNFPRGRRIVPIGIDIEHQEENAFNFMQYCLGKEGIPIDTIQMLDRIENIDGPIKDSELKLFHKELKSELEKNKSIYEKILGNDYFLLHHINDNILNKVEVYSTNNFDGIRDRKIYNNFLNLTKDIYDEKYFGQIGLSHIFQRSFPYVNWLGKALNTENDKFRGKVLSIAYAYDSCRYLYPTRRRDYIGEIDTMDLSVKEFKSFLYSKHTLFRLNQKGSPFKNKLIWPLKHKIPNGGVTVDYFQYLLVVKESKEMESLKGIIK